jgi:hypothetical protein
VVWRRLHLFELNDSGFAPEALRDTIIESLSTALDWGRVLEGLVLPFREFLDRTGAREVLDIAAGAGGPARILARELARAGGRLPRFLLTDLQPKVDAWKRLAAELPGTIDWVAEPVDATRLSPELGKGRACTIINALHHFRPELASSILRGVAEGSDGVFIAEGFERRPLGFASFAPAGLPALLVNPFANRRHFVQKALFTYATPIALASAIWDGLVSTMRVYTEAELREMVAPIAGYEWTYGTYDFPMKGRGYFFHGVRVTAPA